MSDPPLDPWGVPVEVAPANEPVAPGAAIEPWAGAQLWSTLKFLAVPAAIGIAILGFDLRLPSSALYAIALALGLVLLGSLGRDPERLIAVFVLYIPLSRIFVVPIAPGVNGTNSLLVLLVLAWAMQASREGRPMVFPLPNARLVGTWGAVTLFSVVTAGLTFGFGEVLESNGGDLKQWIDNLVVFFAFLYLIRDGAQARRVVLYMMIGAVVVLALGFQEWLDKRWLDRIEKARLLGPQLQPNDFGAFLVYIAGPFVGLFLVHVRRVRAYLLLPFFALLARILLATFSRGAFIGVAVAGVAAGWVRGRVFLLGAALLGVALLAAMPELVPESLSDRMSSTKADSGYGEELDDSSETRLILWKAAVRMSLESPLLGKGFKAFPRLKGNYTETEVREADNHNMFLYVASQMGIPALLMLLWLLWRTYAQGVAVYRSAPDGFGRAIGLGAVAMAAGVVAVNMFGSRLVDIAVTGYFWIYLAALTHVWLETGSDGPASPAEAR